MKVACSGTCRSCLRRRPVYSIQRHGGGNYRRASRWVQSSICLECAADAMTYAGTNLSQPTGGGFSLRGLAAIAAAHPEGLHRVQDWRERCANHAAIRDSQRRRPHASN